VRKEFSPFRFAVYALCALSLFGLRAYGQDKEQAKARPNGIVQDWSRRFAVYPRVGPLKSLIALQNDPRAIESWQEAARQDWHRWRNPRPVRSPKTSFVRDWNISLTTSGNAANVIPAAMFPAKYNFDATGTVTSANCTGDYVAYTVNAGLAPETITATLSSSTAVTITSGTITAAYVGEPVTGTGIPAGTTVAAVGSTTTFTLSASATVSASETLTVSGQPNLVILNNLYSGTAGGTGLCNRPTPVNDDGVSATVYASYFLDAVGGGLISTSPTLSPDGQKIAVVESGVGVRALLEVVAFDGGVDGVDPNSAQNVLLPRFIPGTDMENGAPGEGTGNVGVISLGSASDTNSSPFYVSNADEIYVGDDGGNLYRALNVFCTSAVCQNNGNGMILDSTWGNSGQLPVGGTCTGMLTGPVVDGFGNVFVGCADGNLYGFTSAGLPLTGSPIAVGNGGADGGIVDPPLVDVVNGYLYVASGNNGSNSVVVQVQDTGSTITKTSTATLDPGGIFNVHAPAFNNAYFSGSGTPLLYELSPGAVSSSVIHLSGIGFTSHVMNTTPTDVYSDFNGTFESTPITEFFNGTEDNLFSTSVTNINDGLAFVVNYTVTAGFPSGGSNPDGVGEGEGTGGIIVDNNSAEPQASSIYFGVIGPGGTNANSAVKLTQSGLE